MKRLLFVLLLSSSTVLLSAGQIGDILRTASEMVGTPYRYGGTTPSGFDCSGLLYYLYGRVVPSFPRTSSDQSRAGRLVEKENLKPGDLVFYATGSSRTKITHAALYIGSNTVIQALSQGPQTGVVITDMDERYWKNRYVTSRRVLNPDVPEDKTAPQDTVQEDIPAVAKEKVIDSKGQEKTVVTIGTRRFNLLSWEDWYTQDQAEFGDKRERESSVLEDDLSDFEKWKKQNSPG
ncbi:MAG: C40 family peptidase [Spirochaetales bacterium]|nr:C40 family peptidase [Spirochaetales bacterium]